MATSTSGASSPPLQHRDYPLRTLPAARALRELPADDVCASRFTKEGENPEWTCGAPSWARQTNFVVGVQARELGASAEAERLWCVEPLSEAAEAAGVHWVCGTLDGVRELNATRRAQFEARRRESNLDGERVSLTQVQGLDACTDACKNTKIEGRSCVGFAYHQQRQVCSLYSGGTENTEPLEGGWDAYDAGWTRVSVASQSDVRPATGQNAFRQIANQFR